MFINLTKTEVEETITALEDFQTYLEENGMQRRWRDSEDQHTRA